MNVTSLDFLLLIAVPVTVAVLGTLLWRLAVRHVRPRAQPASPPPALSLPVRERSTAGELAVHASRDARSLSPASRR